MQQAQAMTTVKLKHLGVLQLAAHDLFDVDRTIEHDFENGLLDLSTLLINMRGGGGPFSDAQIMNGGEFRNAENVMIFSVASDLGQNYVTLKNSVGADAARQAVLTEYYNLLDEAYVTAFGEPTPSPAYGCTTMTENLALRTIHDLLPEFVELDDMSMVFIFDFPFGSTLTPTELDKDSSHLDGVFDAAFATDTFIPALGITLNLLEKDQTFGTQFNTEFSFDFFLTELQDGSYDPGDEAMKQIKNLFAKGYGSGCYTVGGDILTIESTSILLAGAQSITWLIPVVLSVVGIGLVFLRKRV